MNRLFGVILLLLRVSDRLRLWRSTILTNSAMESTPKTPWSRKRKQQAKLQRMLDAKCAKVDTSPLPSTSTAPTEATSSGTADQPSEILSQSLQDTAEAQEPMEETLDDSLRVPVAGAYLATLNNRLFWFVSLCLENLPCIFISIIYVLVYKVSVLEHIPLP